jgi:hypothetical protein
MLESLPSSSIYRLKDLKDLFYRITPLNSKKSIDSFFIDYYGADTLGSAVAVFQSSEVIFEKG